MEQEEVQQTHRSEKKLRDIKEFIRDKHFVIPGRFANSRTADGEACILVMANGERTYVPVEKPVAISYQSFCILRDAGVFEWDKNYAVEEDFNPIKHGRN